jgi:exonuclease III
MKGKRSKRTEKYGNSPVNKWSRVRSSMLSRRIGILALQETHLTQQDKQSVENLYSRHLLVFNSAHPDQRRAGASQGVAFVVNKNLVSIEDVRHYVLIPGRAIMMTIKWHNDATLKLINVYTPNDHDEHEDFWTEIEARRRELDLPKPDIMLGDFNVVEDKIDRAPATENGSENIAASHLIDFYLNLDLQDEWRNTYPTSRVYTYRSNPRYNNGDRNISHSRIDRIYVGENSAENVYEWEHGIMDVPSDHHMITVR